MHRIRVEGATEAADRLRVFLHKAGFLLVPDSSAAVTIEMRDGDQLSLDSVDSPLEARIEANLEELDARFKCGTYVKQRASGNRDPERAVLTVPAGLAEGVALAVLRAIVQVSEQATAAAPAPAVVAAPARPWWRFGLAVLFALMPSLASAQQGPPFQAIDADTGAALSPRVFVGLFTAASGGASAVALPTTLGASGGFKVECLSGCGGSGGTSATDNSVFTGGTTSVTPIGALFDATPPTITDGNIGAPRMDGSRYMFVNCAVGCSGSSFADNAAFTFGTTAISIQGGVLDDVAPNAATENSAAAPRISANRMQLFQLGDGAGNERRANVTASNALVVDGSAVTQPISAASLPLPTGAATSANQSTEITSLQKIDNLAHAGADVALSEHVPISGQLDDVATTTVTENQIAPVRITSGRALFTAQQGNVTVNSHDVTNAGTFAVQAAQSGTWTVQPGNTANTTAWLFKISQTTTDNDVDATIAALPNEGQQTAANSISVTPDTDNDAIGATAAAVPGEAMLMAGTDGTNTTVPYIDPCSREARTTYVVDIVTAATTQVAAAVASEFYFICSLDVFSAGTNNVAIVEDDTAACASPTAGLNGGVTAAEGWNFTAQTGIVKGVGSHYVMRTATANRYLCIITSAAVQLSGTITYVSAP